MSKTGVLSTKQKRAIACLLTEKSVVAAAVRAGVAENTLFGWLTQDAFRAALTEAEGQAIDASVRQLVGIASGAIDVLNTTMMDPKATASARVRAAQSVLDSLLKLRELRTLEERISRLEAAQNERFGK